MIEVEIFLDSERVEMETESCQFVSIKRLMLARKEFPANLLNDALLFERRNRSPTFNFQIQRYFRGWYLWKFNLSLIQRFRLYLNRIRSFRPFLMNSLRLLLVIGPFRKLILSRLSVWMSKQEVLVNVEEFADFDLVIIPSNGIDNLLNPLITQLNRNGIKTLVALDNWDNMSSKTNFWTAPNYVSALGPQSARHAEQIQGIRHENIWVIGTPRFESYRPFLEDILEHKGQRSSIVYLGCSVPHNERTLIGNLISSTNLMGQKFVYRPHPKQVPRIGDNIDLTDKIEIDQNVGAIRSDTGQPEMTAEFVASLQNALLIIATPTTLALEAMLLGARVVIDATNDGVNRTTAARAFERYVHLKELLVVEGLPIAHNLADLREHIQIALSNPSSEASSYGIGDLVYFSVDSFASELSKRIKSICN